MQFTVKTRDGDLHSVEAHVGLSLMENIRSAGIEELLAICGGSLSCATCHIYIENLPGGAELSSKSQDEEDLLEASDYLKPNSRLSCQVVFQPPMDGMRIVVAPDE
ncbi:2Fe-2S iron-sulfur cluster-binding protein [Phyllobacterium sp. YR531]|uniref:2Fe-2S iron-sulfur cluster-binding protein n=1 Tax=Phyllobacterium sp. YR531 TaxID=1144343 RepID=UPI00026FC31F|nr:2Fe-2S iron-sulfur cluster-binding protein [Phyllobacterium sp. YR531]EJN06816.1 ferredoxin [Phyllobacterium sp. YR531]